MINRFEHFSFALSEISRYWHKLTSEEMEPYGLRGTHSVYVITLAQYNDGLTAPELCQLCHKDKADVSRMMSIMIKKGLVIKESAYQNKYNGVFKLTDAGLEVASHVQAKADYAVNYAGRSMTDAQRVVFYASLDSIVENLQKLSDEGIPSYDSLI